MGGGTRHMANLAAFSILVYEIVEHGPVSAQDLAEETGLHLNTVRKAVNCLMRRPKRTVHLSGWGKDSRGAYMIPLYSFGDRRDSPKPKTKRATRAELRERKAVKAWGSASSRFMQHCASGAFTVASNVRR